MWNERGVRWVVLQWALLLAILLAPRFGPRPPRAVARVARALGLPLLATGGTLMASSVAHLGPNVTPLPKPKDDATLVQTGLYARVRHPIYTAFDLLAFGWALTTASPLRLVLAVALAAFFDKKANREEAWLIERFPEYVEYRAQVSRFLPGLY